ncbi:MAG: RNA polymerase alpha subunit C-terminal domain-containing protein [Ferruginibacter sp.]
MPAAKTLRTCKNGHQYYKSSDCPVCPVCEKENKPQEGFLSLLSAPAKRALQQKGITTLRRLASHSEKEILQLHGMGPASIPGLKAVLKQAGLSFKK